MDPLLDELTRLREATAANPALSEALQQVEAALHQARKTADGATRARGSFLANLSTVGHELRTPLNAILGFAQLLRQDRNLPPEQHTQIEIIHRSGEQLLAMINDLLDISRMEAGVKSSFVSNDNVVDYQRQLSDKSWMIDNRSNHFVYDENINAAYLNANKQLGKWSLQGGLRLENTIAKGLQVTNDSTFTRNFTNLFPSAFVSYAANKNNSVTLSYSRRITRPSYRDLNPFTFFLDSLTYQVGNPYLLPQFTNNLELNYAFKSRYIVGFNYNHTNDVISQIMRQDNAKQITFLTSENVAKFRNIGVSITIPATIAKWWNTNFFTNIYNNRYEGIYNNEPLDIAYTSFSANLSNTFTIKPGFTAEISGFYRHTAVDQLTVVEPLYQMSLAASKQIMNGKGSLRLNIRDPFAWQRFKGKNQYGDIDMRFRNFPDVRQVTATFTLRFGKSTPQNQPRRRNSSSQEEQSRVGQG